MSSSVNRLIYLSNRDSRALDIDKGVWPGDIEVKEDREIVTLFYI
jgi:hypothetical protein